MVAIMSANQRHRPFLEYCRTVELERRLATARAVSRNPEGASLARHSGDGGCVGKGSDASTPYGYLVCEMWGQR